MLHRASRQGQATSPDVPCHPFAELRGIVSGQRPLQGIELMGDALDHFSIDGIAHNIPFLQAVMNHQRFRAGKLSTNFIAESSVFNSSAA